MKESGGEKRKPGEHKAVPMPVLILSGMIVLAIICLLIFTFYHSLEREIYEERAAYLQEISGQVVATTENVSSAQWNLSSFFANRLEKKQVSTTEELSDFIREEQEIHNQKGLSFLAFDENGNYYGAQGQARWLGSLAVIREDSPERQVEITTLPTTANQTDEMVFVLRLDSPLTLPESGVTLTHVAVVRDMSVFYQKFRIPSFEGKGENYIISNMGTRVYRGQESFAVIGDVYNVLKPLEQMKFQYGGSYQALKEAVSSGKSCSLEFTDESGAHYFVTSSPMETNDWSLLSVIPSSAVSERMQRFMNVALFGMGAIALVVVAAISLAMLFVLRFRSSQQLMKRQAEANAALQEAAQAAEEASRAKTIFLSHMSHDIRTPINGIMGMTDIAVRHMEDPARVEDCLRKITSSSRHLLSLINDVLDMSRIESGKVQIDNKPFYVGALLDGCASVVAGQALEKNLVLHNDFSGVTQSLLLGDELHLRQIFINILGNAVKFTPEGGEVWFTARDRVLGEGFAELTVVIRDNGVGMSKAFQTRIFEPFAQAENGARSEYKGTGLGMSIVKQLLDLMGGSIELESTPGVGSTFTVRLRLPIETSPAQEAPACAVTVQLNGMRVLLVEDNDLNMEIARFMLEESGVQVTGAENGKEALDLFTGNPEGTYDLILMDVMMPVMDGLAAARAIRASGRGDAQSIPIVAMTANAYAEDRKAVLEAGMNRHLAKPMAREELLQVLGEFYKGYNGISEENPTENRGKSR